MSLNSKKIRLKYSYLQCDLEETESICHKMELEIRKFLQEHYPKYFNKWYSNKIQEVQHEDHSSSKKEVEPKPKELKKIYHKIASVIHPDNQEDGDTELFKKAAKAYENNNVSQLLEVASEKNIEIPEMSEASVLLMDEKNKEIEREIEKLKNTVAWKWNSANTEEDKHYIIKVVLELKGETLKDE